MTAALTSDRPMSPPNPMRKRTTKKEQREKSIEQMLDAAEELVSKLGLAVSR